MESLGIDRVTGVGIRGLVLSDLVSTQPLELRTFEVVK